MKRQILITSLSMLLLAILFAACKKDVALPNKDNKVNRENTMALAKKIEKDVADFKSKFLQNKSNIDNDGESMDAFEAINMIETDLNYTYAQTWVAEGVVNNQFKLTFPYSSPTNGEYNGSEIYEIYHTALNDIIATNNNLTEPDKKLTWIDLELQVGDDGGYEIVVTYLFAYLGPEPIQTFNYSGYWHWNNGGVSTGLGFFNQQYSTNPVVGQWGGAAGQINAAAQNNYNYLQWSHNLTGYYVGNITYTQINYVTNPLYFNPQIAQWRDLSYVPGLTNQFCTDANTISPAANVYPEASYRAEFQVPTPIAPASAVPNGYWWNFDRECLPDYALNFYTERTVDFAKDVMPTTGILPSGQGVYSFNLSGLHTHQPNLNNPNISIVKLNHVIDLNVGTFIQHTQSNVPQALPGQPTAI